VADSIPILFIRDKENNIAAYFSSSRTDKKQLVIHPRKLQYYKLSAHQSLRKLILNLFTVKEIIALAVVLPQLFVIFHRYYLACKYCVLDFF
jgi:hypothetical protein